jgi:hypothetical protein
MKLYAVVKPGGAVVLSSLAKTPEKALQRMSQIFPPHREIHG